MRKLLVVIAAASLAGPPAAAEVWMIKSSGVVGCRDRDVMRQHEIARASQGGTETPPEGCFVLYAGERLLDQPEVGVGFDEFMRVERHDGSLVFVRSSAVVPDPGIGSVTGDRAE